ncbi:MAG TPA: sulfatase [Steroidobacteraceae bacterium]|nr:sulfatase [Steroidobacteraceae bacterium]
MADASSFERRRFAASFLTWFTVGTLALLAGGSTHAVGVEGDTAARMSQSSSGRDAASEVAAPDATLARPNVVIVLADDLDTHSLARMVGLGLMPKLKSKVIDTGTQFSNSFVTTSWCCPSRATLFTGLYSHNHNVFTNSRPLGGVHRFDDSSTLALWLQKGGYRTGLVGKYFNNYGADNDPTTPVDDHGYVPPGWNDWQGLMDDTVDGLRAFQMYDYTINDNGRLVRHGTATTDYQTDVIARRARDFIVESDALDDARPFFLLVAPTAPHLEGPTPVLSGCADTAWNQSIRPAPRHAGTLPATVQAPRPANFNEADMRDKPSWMRQVPALTTQDVACLKRQYRDRLTSLRAVDDLVGMLVSALQARDEWSRTVFIFTSDNGYFLGNHRLTDKVLGYEESIRVPLYIRAPGFPRQVTTRAALTNDLASTVTDFAGITPGLAVDGRSLLPLLRNPLETNWRKRFLVEYLGSVESSKMPPRVPFRAVRTTDLSRTTPADQFYVEWQDGLGSKEFYNLPADPGQLASRHADPSWAGVRNLLAGWLSQFRNCGGGSCQALEDQ